MLWLAGFVFAWATYAWTGCLSGTGTSCSTTTQVQVEILPGNICIGSTGAFNFGQYTVSASSQTVTGTFTSPFYVDDLKGSSTWYYTTVQLSGALVQSGWSGVIPSANVFMQTTAVGSGGVTLITGSANSRVQIDGGMSAYQSLDSARQLIERNLAANFGLIGQYGVTPLMQLIIPAYQPVGIYTATLVYTLYEN